MHEFYTSKNQAFRHLAEGIKDEKYRQCGNLDVGVSRDVRGLRFYPCCLENSFEESEIGAVTNAKKKRAARLQTAKLVCGHIIKIVSVPFAYVVQLDRWAQFLVVMLIIFLFLPRFGPILLKIIEAIKK
jgi:predicted transcriptional regulator